MDKFCISCGAELDENGNCPNCAPNAAPSEEVADKPAEATPAVPVNLESDEGFGNAEIIYEPQQYEREEPAPAENRVQPSKFYFTFKQVGNIFKHFFSKHTVDAISAQYNEILPIWAIMLPLCAIIDAFSALLSYDSSGGRSVGLGNLFTDMSMSYFEVFIVSLAVSVSTLFAFSFGVKIYMKALKKPGNFKSAANLTSCAHIPFSLISLFNIVTVGWFSSEYSLITTFGYIAFGILLYIGIIKVLDNKKPFWSFFLMMTCVFFGLTVIALVLSSPIIVMRALQSLVNGIS